MSEAARDVVVLIPVFNEAAFIGQVVAGVREQAERVLVVDDGSTDGTAEAAEQRGAEVIRVPRNQGKGNAIRTGVEQILKGRVQWVVIMDGDGQHLPAELGRFLAQRSLGDQQVVVGRRSFDRKVMPLVRLWTNRLTSALISWRCGQSVPDSQCGYRMLPRRALEILLAKSTRGRFDFETEMLFILSRAGFQITSVPISTVYGDEESSVRPVRDTARFLRLVLRDIFR